MLADELSSFGISSVFIMSLSSLPFVELVHTHGHRVSLIRYKPSSPWDLQKNPDWTSESLATDESRDCSETLRALSGEDPQLVVLDHYFLTQRWLDGIRQSLKCRLLVLEDLPRRWTDVDVLVNTNARSPIQLDSGHRTVVLQGPRYVALDASYRDRRNHGISPVTQRGKLSLFVGSGDSTQLLFNGLNAFRLQASESHEIHVVLATPDSKIQQKIADLNDPRVRVHAQLASLSEIYSDSLLAIGTGGTSSWERACLGVPALLSTVSENQTPVCLALEELRAARYLGRASFVTQQQLSDLVNELIKNANELESMSSAGLRAVDGYGARRVSLLSVSELQLTPSLRPVEERDVDILFNWFHDPDSRQNSLGTNEVGWFDHLRWFLRRLHGDSGPYYIMELYGLPIGQIRFDFTGHDFLLSYSIDRDFRARGFGRLLVEHGVAKLASQGITRVRALVRSSNVASIRIFESQGFSRAETTNSDVLEYVRD